MLRLMRWADTFLLLGMPVLIAGLMVWATLTPGNAPIGLAIGWLVAVSWGVFGILATLKKMTAQKQVKFTTTHGISVGWSNEDYVVTIEDVTAVVNDTLLKMKKKFPDGAKALAGCFVMFHHKTYKQASTGRMVAGEQDGPILIVGWNARLTQSALQHELAHRILQIYANDPPEVLAHSIMSELGVV